VRKNRLGNSDLYLSAIGLGTWAIGGDAHSYGWGSQDDKESIATIHRALELGINWLDTAPVYGLGHSEEIIGKAIAGKRDKVIISTKCGTLWNDRKRIYNRLTEDSIRSEAEASLKRLKTDVIDLYQIHVPFPDEDIEEAWRVLAELKKEGKIRYAGVSNFDVKHLKRLQPVQSIASSQPMYNMLDREVEHEHLDFCAANHIGVIAFSPMSRGLLTGKFNHESIKNLPAGDHRRTLTYFREPQYSANLRLVEKLSPIARRNEKSLAQLAIAWVLRRSEVTAAIVGARNPAQIEQTAQAADWDLSPEDERDLDGLLEEYGQLLKALPPVPQRILSAVPGISTGDNFSPNLEREFALDVSGIAGSSGLNLNFAYNKYRYDRATMERFVSSYKANLLKIIGHCVKKKEKELGHSISSVDYQIKKDHDAYLQRFQQEQFPEFKRKSNYRHLLLTGGTGFLGAYLIPQLLENTAPGSKLYLLIRAGSKEEAETRVMKKLAFYFGDQCPAAVKDRITFLAGDLRKDKLGLANGSYEKLCQQVDAVVHPAANVKHYGLYEEFYKDNVQGTEELLEFALKGKKKDFHYVSTLDVGYGDIPGREHMVYTEYCHDVGQQCKHLYIKSKFEAEKKVVAYRQKGLHTSIYRAGNLFCHSETGRFQENIDNNYFYAVIKGIIKLGLLPDIMEQKEYDISFINYSARAIAMLINCDPRSNETYHITNPNKLLLKDLAGYLREFGFAIENVNFTEMSNRLAQFNDNSEYEQVIERAKLHSGFMEERVMTKIVSGSERTVNLLEKLGFTWPEVTKKHIRLMVDHCKEVGFL
jgi:thioester reductase-like protein